MTAPGTLSWRWKLAVAGGSNSTLQFQIDGSNYQTLGGTTDWTLASSAINGAGATKIRWRLVRNTPAPAGTTDAAYLDTVVYSALATPVATAATQVTPTTFTANWSAPATATNYQFQLSTVADFSTPLYTVNTSSNSYAVTGLTAGTTYYYRARAAGASTGFTPFSNVITTITATVSAPVASAATSVASTSFVMNWSSVTGATGYSVDVSTAANFTSAVTTLPLGATTTATFGSALPTTTYYYRVRAITPDGTSPNSNVITVVTTSQPSAPAIITQPANATATAGQSATFSVTVSGVPTPTIQWQRQPAGTTGFADVGASSLYSGVATLSLTVTAVTAAMHGDQFRAVASNGSGSPAISNPGTLSANFPPSITSLANTRFTVAQANTFTFAATGRPAPTFTVTTGTLPSWATLNATTGVLAGTPPDATGSPFTFTITASNGTTPNATQAFTLIVQALHSADSSGDWVISLAELTRVIQLYNTRNGSVRTGRYLVQPTGTEDGFNVDSVTANGATVTLTRYHSADTNRDGKITLTELTRLIELYNTRSGSVRTGAYHEESGTEDGFAPGP